MANLTPNYNLAKPLITEKYDVNLFNGNADKLDLELDKVSKRVDTIITTPAAGVSAQEITDARQGEVSLGANLTAVKSLLVDKASKAEARLNITKLKLEDADADFLGAIAGTGTFNLLSIPQDSSVTKKKLEVNLQNKFHSVEQLTKGFFMFNGTILSNITKVTDSTIEMLTTTTYGHAGLTVPNINGHKYKVFTAITNIGDIAVSLVRMMLGYNNSPIGDIPILFNGTGVGANNSLAVGASLTREDEVISNNATYSAVSFAMTTTTNGARLRISQRVYDITNLTDEVKNAIDWSNPAPYMLFSELAKIAISAKEADTSKWAEDGNFSKLVQKYENISGNPKTIPSARIYGNGTGIFEYVDGVISAIPTESWGQLLIRQYDKISQGKKLLVTCLAKTDVASLVRMSVYQYASSGPVGGTDSIAVGLSSTWRRISYVLTLNLAGVARIDAGVTNMSGTPYPKIYMKDFMLIDITSDNLDVSEVDSMGGVWNIYPDIVPNAQYAKVALNAINKRSLWKDKKVLVMGDSLTASLKWQNTVASLQQCAITTHAKGGIGITQVVDGSAPLLPLSTELVADKDLIILFIGMNDRSALYGVQGDLYPAQATVHAKMQYVINTIYDRLTTAGNLDCKILVITPHCAGKYEYVDVDGYGEYPAGTGQTLEKMSDIIKKNAQYNNCQVADLWHDSGIGRRTWSIYTASPTPVRTVPLAGVPYPNNTDQLHLSDLGYTRIGEVIAERMDFL